MIQWAERYNSSNTLKEYIARYIIYIYTLKGPCYVPLQSCKVPVCPITKLQGPCMFHVQRLEFARFFLVLSASRLLFESFLAFLIYKMPLFVLHIILLCIISYAFCLFYLCVILQCIISNNIQDRAESYY